MSEQKMREALEQILHKAANGAWTRHEVEACAREALAQHPAAGAAVTVRYDLSAVETESAIRSKLIEMGWTPPDQQPAAVVELTDIERFVIVTNWFDEPWAIDKATNMLGDYDAARIAKQGGGS